MNKKTACLTLLLPAILASVNISYANRYVNEIYIDGGIGNQNYSNNNIVGKRFEAPEDMSQWGNYWDENSHSYKPLPAVYQQVAAGEGSFNLVNGQYEYVGEGNGNYNFIGGYTYGDLMPDQYEGYGGGFENNGIMYYFNNNKIENNKADIGGGLYNFGLIKAAENNTFTNNTATVNGGAIYNEMLLGNVSGTFTGNKAEGSAVSVFYDGDSGDGGAIYNFGVISRSIKTEEDEEDDWDDDYEIGDVVTTAYSAEIDSINGKFEKNSAQGNGGAIYNAGEIKTINGTFTNNTAVTGRGGAIYNRDFSLDMPEIEKGKWAEEREAYLDGQKLGSIESVTGTFSHNAAALGGGAIYNKGKINSLSAEFTENGVSGDITTMHGGALMNEGEIEELKDSNFSRNSSTINGGAIYNTGTINSTGTIKYENNSSVNGGAIANEKIAISSGFDSEGNEIITETEGTFNISRYSTFSGNKASQNGGAIYNTGEITTSQLSNQNFKSNTAEEKGGAIYNSGKVTLGGNSANSGNSVTFSANKAQDGGAIYNEGEFSAQKTSFDNNTATNNGGAIYNTSTNININNLKFTKNKAENSGGALYNEGSINLNQNTFEENSAKNGGAVTLVNGTSEIKNSTFKNNIATEKGGAIYATSGTNLTLTDNTFSNNKASKGGLLYAEDSTVNIKAQDKDVKFAGNTADLGSAIYLSNGTLNLETANNRSITFDDSIAGSGIINASGNIILNNSVTPDEGNLQVNLTSGTIKTSIESYLNGTDLTLANGTTLDLMNNHTGALNLNSLNAQNANLKIDMDLANELNPFDTISANTATGTLNISDVNFMSEMADGTNSVSAEMKLDNLTLNFPDNNMHIMTNDSFYIITQNDDNITIDRLHDEDGNAIKVDGFTLAVNKDATVGGEVDISLNDERSFSATNNVSVTGSGISEGWTGNLGGTKLTVNGNNYTIDGNGNSAINVKDNQIIEFNDANITGFDENAIYLDGTGLAQANLKTSKTMVVDNNIGSNNLENKLNLSGNGTLKFNGTVDNLTLTNENSNTIHNNKVTNSVYNIKGGMTTFTQDNYLSDNGNSLLFNGGTLNIANGTINQVNINELTLNANSNIMVDADLAEQSMDTINATTINDIADGVNLNVSGINLLSDSKDKYTEINFVNDETLKDHITTTVSTVAYSPIYRYNVGYDPMTGNFGFTRGAGNKYSEVNPAVMVAPVAAQIGGYLTQLNTYDQAFANMDMTMLMTRAQRQALKMYNKYAISNTKLAPIGMIPDTPGVIPEEKNGVWARPYTTFENVKFKNGPKVSNVMYGSFFGGDTSLKEFRHGFDGIFSAYVGYNGSHQSFDGNSMNQNGASVGITGTLYKGNWFGGWTVAGGISGVDASTRYGSDDFMLWTAGTAIKTGYNWELFRNKFIIQPHMMASYTFVDTEDYKNALSYKISSDPLNAIQLVPGVKFIGNLQNSWQPYLGIDYVWNIMDKTKFNVADASLPELSMKPYIQYGVGVQKRWGERFTGFLQAMFRGGGRNGVIFSFGFRSALGKEKSSL